MDDTKKNGFRYSLIITTKNEMFYCYNPWEDRFERIFNKSGEIKTPLPIIDELTCKFENQEKLAEYYGIEGEIEKSFIKYYQGGPVLIKPVYNNEEWIPVAKSCTSYKLDLGIPYNDEIFRTVYRALVTNFQNSDLTTEKQMNSLSTGNHNLLVTLIAHERMIQRKNKYNTYSISGNVSNLTREDREDQMALYGDLKDLLKHYRELRSLYMVYYYKFRANENKETKHIAQQPKEKTKELKRKNNPKVAVGQISMFDDGTV